MEVSAFFVVQNLCPECCVAGNGIRHDGSAFSGFASLGVWVVCVNQSTHRCQRMLVNLQEWKAVDFCCHASGLDT